MCRDAAPAVCRAHDLQGFAAVRRTSSTNVPLPIFLPLTYLPRRSTPTCAQPHEFYNCNTLEKHMLKANPDIWQRHTIRISLEADAWARARRGAQNPATSSQNSAARATAIATAMADDQAAVSADLAVACAGRLPAYARTRPQRIRQTPTLGDSTMTRLSESSSSSMELLKDCVAAGLGRIDRGSCHLTPLEAHCGGPSRGGHAARCSPNSSEVGLRQCQGASEQRQT